MIQTLLQMQKLNIINQILNINLLKFFDAEGGFNVDLFKKAVNVMITAWAVPPLDATGVHEKVPVNGETLLVPAEGVKIASGGNPRWLIVRLLPPG